MPASDSAREKVIWLVDIMFSSVEANFSIFAAFVYTNSALFQHPTHARSIFGSSSHFSLSKKQRTEKIQTVKLLTRDASCCHTVNKLKMSVTYFTSIVMAKGTSLSPKVLPFGLKYLTVWPFGLW